MNRSDQLAQAAKLAANQGDAGGTLSDLFKQLEMTIEAIKNKQGIENEPLAEVELPDEMPPMQEEVPKVEMAEAPMEQKNEGMMAKMPGADLIQKLMRGPKRR